MDPESVSFQMGFLCIRVLSAPYFLRCLFGYNRSGFGNTRTKYEQASVVNEAIPTQIQRDYAANTSAISGQKPA